MLSGSEREVSAEEQNSAIGQPSDVGSTSSSSSDTSSEAEDDLEIEVWASDNTESDLDVPISFETSHLQLGYLVNIFLSFFQLYTYAFAFFFVCFIALLVFTSKRCPIGCSLCQQLSKDSIFSPKDAISASPPPT